MHMYFWSPCRYSSASCLRCANDIDPRAIRYLFKRNLFIFKRNLFFRRRHWVCPWYWQISMITDSARLLLKMLENHQDQNILVLGSSLFLINSRQNAKALSIPSSRPHFSSCINGATLVMDSIPTNEVMPIIQAVITAGPELWVFASGSWRSSKLFRPPSF